MTFAKRSVGQIPHVVEPGPPGSLLPPLHDLYTFNVGTVDLEPHLHAHPSQLVSQQNTGINPSPPNIQADTCEWVPAL